MKHCLELTLCGLQSYDVADFPALIEKYEKLNWKIISKPGGATVKPDDFYTLYGSVSVKNLIQPRAVLHYAASSLMGPVKMAHEGTKTKRHAPMSC